MTLASKSLTSLLEDFRSSAPTPGGGSAAALAGALGASLLTMVATLPKPQATAGDLDQLRSIAERSTMLATQLEVLIDRDAEAYDDVMRAYRLPKGSDADKAARQEQIQVALKTAIDIPLTVMRACAAGASHASALVTLGNPNAASDVGVGLELLRAGLRGARLNVEINLKSVKDPTYVDAVRREVDELLSESGATDGPNASA